METPADLVTAASRNTTPTVSRPLAFRIIYRRRRRNYVFSRLCTLVILLVTLCQTQHLRRKTMAV